MNSVQWLVGVGAFVLLILSHLIWGVVDVSLFLPLESVHRDILVHVRIPRVLAAIAGGAGLSLCGLVLQTWFSNPLAGPSVLGGEFRSRIRCGSFGTHRSNYKLVGYRSFCDVGQCICPGSCFVRSSSF